MTSREAEKVVFKAERENGDTLVGAKSNCGFCAWVGVNDSYGVPRGRQLTRAEAVQLRDFLDERIAEAKPAYEIKLEGQDLVAYQDDVEIDRRNDTLNAGGRWALLRGLSGSCVLVSPSMHGYSENDVLDSRLQR